MTAIETGERASGEPADIIVVSDLHLGRGRNRETGRYHALETFFYDDDFLRFCRYLRDDAGKRGAASTLVLDGDIFDLLRIEPEVTAGATPLERLFGPVSTPSVATRLMRQILAGHPVFVRALAELLLAGHTVVLLPGNHDIEVQWEPVQEELRAAMRAALAELAGAKEVRRALGRFRIEPWFYHEPGRIWIEHGCQYDPDNAFRYLLRGTGTGIPDAVWRAELDVPLGNFFQRYLYNGFGHITFIVPSARTNLRYLKWMLLNEPRLVVGVLARHLPFAFQVLRRIAGAGRRARRDLSAIHRHSLAALARSSGLGERLLAVDRLKQVRADAVQAARALGTQLLKLVGGAALLGGFSIGLWFMGFLAINELSSGLWLKALLFLVLNFLALLAAGAGLTYGMLRGGRTRPGASVRRAAQSVADVLDVPLVVFGHTHDEMVARLRRESGRAWYYNTGTWIAVFTQDVLLPRERVQYTFLRVRGEEGELLHWSPGRGEPLPVILLDELPSAAGAAVSFAAGGGLSVPAGQLELAQPTKDSEPLELPARAEDSEPLELPARAEDSEPLELPARAEDSEPVAAAAASTRSGRRRWGWTRWPRSLPRPGAAAGDDGPAQHGEEPVAALVAPTRHGGRRR